MSLPLLIKNLPIGEELSQSDEEISHKYKQSPFDIQDSDITNFISKIDYKYEKYKNIENLFINIDDSEIKRFINYIFIQNLLDGNDIYNDDSIDNIILYDIIIYFAIYQYKEIIEYNITNRTDVFENLNKGSNYSNLIIPSETIKKFNIKKLTKVTNKKKFIYLFYIMIYKLCCLKFYKENECIPLFDDILSLSYDLNLFNKKEYEYFINLDFEINFSYFKILSAGDHFANTKNSFIEKYKLFDDEEFKIALLDFKISEREKKIDNKKCYFISYSEFLKTYINHILSTFYNHKLTEIKEDILKDNKSFYKNYPDEDAKDFHWEIANNDYLFLVIRTLFEWNQPQLKDFYNKIIRIKELKYISSNVETNYRFYLTFGILVITPEYEIEYPDNTILFNIINILNKYKVNIRLYFPIINNIKIVEVYELISALTKNIMGNSDNYNILVYNINYMLYTIKIIKESNIKDEIIETRFNKIFFDSLNIELVENFDKYKNKHIILIFYLLILGIDVSTVKYLIGFLVYSNEMNLTNYNKNLSFIDEFKNYIIYNIVCFKDNYNFYEEIYENEYFTKSNKDGVVDIITYNNINLIPLISLIEISAGIAYNYKIKFSERKEKLIKHFIEYFNKEKKPKEYDYLIKKIFPKFNDTRLSNISDYYYKKITIYI